jgi:hypothetical protein
VNPASPWLYRRQFLLGPRPIEGLEGWPRRHLGPLHLATHPELGVHESRSPSGDASLTLLGYALDPERPDAGDREIVEGWLSRWIAGEDLFEIVHAAAGRFALVALRPGARWILQDAAGFRTVVHTVSAGERVWCASDTPILATQLGLREDPRRRRRWVDATDRSIVWLPLRETLYEECRALVPNHVLDLDRGEPRRFWPVRPIEPRAPDEVADEAADELRRIVEAGARRFRLALGLTAGIDSRMLLAALRDRSHELFVFTFCRHPERRPRRDDVRIPAEMLARFGLAHHLLGCDAPDDPALRAVFEASHAAPSETRWAEVRDLLRHLPPGSVRVSGHVGEAARATFLPRVDTSLRRLMRRSHPGSVLAARRALAPWYAEAREVSRRTGYTVRDLHYWESRMGRWAAASQNQYDFAAESFTPFACRALLERLLSVDERHRAKDAGSPLSVEIVRRLWPELAEHPVNPQETLDRQQRAGRLSRRRVRRWWRTQHRALWARVHR